MKPERMLADTNLFLRYLTNDVPEQADAVEMLLERAAGGEVTLAVTSLTIAEIVWTLESYYELSRQAVHEKILAILNTPGVEVQDADLVLQSSFWYAEENVDFIDAFNAAWCLAEGLDGVYTFDQRHFSRIGGLEVRSPLRGSG